MTTKRKLKAMFGGRNDVVTPLMGFLAGEHAARLAEQWPAPHEGFFALPTARRHAAAILFADLAAEGPTPNARKQALVEFERDAEVARAVMGDRAAGFMRMLGKLGETLWTTANYRGLIELYADPNASRALRHMPVIAPEQFEPMLALPPMLREPNILAHIGGKQAAKDLALAFDLALRMRGPRVAPRLAERWDAARSRERLFEMAAEDLAPDVFRPPLPAPDLPPPYGRITTRKALFSLAQEFQNCLRDFVDDVARGRMAVYAWRGPQPAAVALTWDAAGWRLAEAEAPANTELDEPTLRALIAPLAERDIRTGLPLSILGGRLDQHRRGETPYDQGDGFVDQLMLGELWA